MRARDPFFFFGGGGGWGGGRGCGGGGGWVPCFTVAFSSTCRPESHYAFVYSQGLKLLQNLICISISN